MLFKKTNIISFSKTLKKSEGKKGAVVTLLASLELAKDGIKFEIKDKKEKTYTKSFDKKLFKELRKKYKV